MTTTIAVQEDTIEMLKTMKEQVHAKSFDEIIRQLIMKAKKPKIPLYGIAKNTPEFVREEIDRFV
jgi:predicted CopG family antitoxin